MVMAEQRGIVSKQAVTNGKVQLWPYQTVSIRVGKSSPNTVSAARCYFGLPK